MIHQYFLALDSPDVNVPSFKLFALKDLIRLIMSTCACILEMVSSLSSFKTDLFRINTATCGLGNKMISSTNFQLNEWTNMNIHIWQYYNKVNIPSFNLYESKDFISSMISPCATISSHVIHAIICSLSSLLIAIIRINNVQLDI